MQGLVLAALLTFASPPDGAADAGRGALELRAAPGERLVVVSEDGETVADVTGRDPGGDPIRLVLPPGSYTVRDAGGGTVGSVSLSPGATAGVETAAAGAWQPPEQVEQPSLAPPPTRSNDAIKPLSDEEVRRRRRKRAKKVGAPIASAFIPGLGQFINRKPAKGAGFLLGAVVVGGASILLDEAGSERADGTRRPIGVEYARLGALGLLSSGLGVLWAAGILDAYKDAAEKEPSAKVDYKVQIQAARFASVGPRPLDRAGLFQTFSLSFLGQPVRNLSVGISDLAIAQDSTHERSIFEGGLRVGYSFYHLRRFWLGGSGGAVVQGSAGPDQPPPLDTDASRNLERDVAVTPYLQMDGRIFLLDRWSIDVMPRVSMPVVGTRHFAGGKSIGRFSTTFELGTALSVQF